MPRRASGHLLHFASSPGGRPRGGARRSAAALALVTCAATGLTAAAALTTAAVPAAAATAAGVVAAKVAHPQYWVSQSSTSSADTSCASAASSTIQSAVYAAAAFTRKHHKAVPVIEVCPGTYAEQVTITSSLEITRAPVPASQGQVVIQLPAAVGESATAGESATFCQDNDAATSTQLPTPIIEICSATAGGVNTTGVSVSLSHLTVQGNWQFTSCAVQMYGILVEGGASLSLTGSVVEQVGDYPLQGCQSGVAVDAGNSVTGQIGHLAMSGDTIESYQKNGVVVDGPGSTGRISGITVHGAGPTAVIAQNGIQISIGATASVAGSTITGDNYTGTGEASSAGVLVFGGGGKVCGNGKNTPLVKNASFTRNTLINNDLGIALFNVNNECDASTRTPTRDVACYNSIRNTHGYPGGVASADANISGLVTTKYGAIGDQAGVSDTGNRDVICHNYINGAGYAPRGKTSTLPNPKPPAWVRPVDLFSYAAALKPDAYANKYDGKAYKPR
jgi:hypothetical protein